MLIEVVIILLKVGVIFVALLTTIAYTTYLERKVVAHIQHRIGPNIVGPFGLLQPVADAVKLLFKEEIKPAKADQFFYTIAPMLSFITACMTIAVIPVGNWLEIGGKRIELLISDINIGILYIFAMSSLGVYGIVLAGWSSNSKYSLLGGIRSTAQMISYEVSLGLGIIGVLLLSQTLSVAEIVRQQSGSIFNWYFFKQPIAFFVYFISAIAETNRSPFDLPEAESELVAGYHTEYSGMRFGIFYLSEYANMITVSAIAASLFFGGWNGPILPPVLWFVIKVVIFLFIYVWIRGTLPRFRYDQLMRFGWKVMFPLGLANLIITALILVMKS
ncbi:MAG: NADH-quinone oxidoreductase subunit H [candidate division Zixibacteria bacterium RBG_16_53_22]|nr:MAG: NADH-quinone oxidoreductase subunit H [candidate division Zixibacteria bacterium RBG_16_53_22]